MEEKLLRDLTCEICFLFSVFASPGLNATVPSLEQAGQMSQIDDSSKDLNAFAGCSIVGFILHHKTLAVPVLKICIEAFSWTIFAANKMPLHLLQILLSLPCITEQDLLAFEEALSKTGSPKEQKQHMKSLLIMATGNKLKALATQKGLNVITNVTTRFRNLDAAPKPSHGEEDSIGLAAIM